MNPGAAPYSPGAGNGSNQNGLKRPREEGSIGGGMQGGHAGKRPRGGGPGN